jgi:hypothetical protein
LPFRVGSAGPRTVVDALIVAVARHDASMGERVAIPGGRVAVRVGIGVLWGLVMVALVWGGAWLGIVLLDGVGTSALAGVGSVIGVVLAVVVCRRARLWIQRWRLRLMASHLVTATATVCQVDRYQTQGRAPNRTIYTVWFSWTDATAGAQLRERQYGFFASGLREFEVRVVEGARVAVRYPAGRPGRFIADIPYSATMADQFM